MREFDCDVLVVGAGLAGLAAAGELAERGHRVTLVDVKSVLERGVHTTGIFVRRTLEDFVLPEDALGPVVRRVVLHSPAGREFALESEHDEYRVGRMGHLYAALLARAEGAGVDWLPGTRYRSSAPVTGGSAVWLEQGGRRWRVRARLLVGADGAVSRVAQHLGLEENRAWLAGVEDVFEGSATPGPPALHCYLEPRLAPGYIAWLVDDGEQTHAGVAGYAARFEPAAALRAFRERLQREFALERLQRVERRGGRIPVNGILRRIGCTRGLLIGDAAGAVSPLTAGGLDPCLRLTRLAVAHAAEYLEGGAAASLEAYSGAPFQRHFMSRLLLRRALNASRHPALAELALLLLGGPFRALAAKVFFGRGSFPDIELATARVARSTAQRQEAVLQYPLRRTTTLPRR